jgi:hypothetical protein
MTRSTSIGCAIAALALSTVASALPPCTPQYLGKLNDAAELAFDYYGTDVDIDGSRMIVGSWGDDGAGANSGIAYVYHKIGNTWTKKGTLSAPDAATEDRFAEAVAISGDWAVVGGRLNDDAGTSSGSAYVYQWNGTNWVFNTKLLQPDGEQYDFFGCDVAISGDRIVIGSYFKDVFLNYNRASAGSAYVFKRSGVAWTFEQKLIADNPAPDAWFGYSVAIDGSRIAVGAPGTPKVGFQFGPGAAYFFEYSNGNWNQTDKRSSSNTTATERFGWTVAMDGDTTAVGAPMHNFSLGDPGAVYAFQRNANGTWTETDYLEPVSPEVAGELGTKVDIDGDVIVASAPYATMGGLSGATGGAVIYGRVGGVWNAGTAIQAPAPAIDDLFSQGVAINGSTVVIGSERDDDMGGNSGTVYFYEPSCPEQSCPGDLNGDGVVNAADLSILLGSWNTASNDLDGNGIVNAADLSVLLGAWGNCG